MLNVVAVRAGASQSMQEEISGSPAPWVTGGRGRRMGQEGKDGQVGWAGREELSWEGGL